MFTPNPEFEAKKAKDREQALLALRNATYVFPQQRLGQLLSNAIHHTPWARDPFSMPDASLAGYLDEYMRGVKGTVREDNDAAEVARLRKALEQIDQFAADALHPVKVAPYGYKVVAHVCLMAADALQVLGR